jgi:hypothetical protein
LSFKHQTDIMSPTDKVAVIGHGGWAARSILKVLASQPFTKPIRVLARENSNADALPENTEVARYSWEDKVSIANALEGVDVLLYFTSQYFALRYQLMLDSSFIGHDGLSDQKKLIPHMRDANLKLFAPSDLALPYTAEERTDVQVPREKLELEHELNQAQIPFVTICIGNMTSFALDSP